MARRFDECHASRRAARRRPSPLTATGSAPSPHPPPLGADSPAAPPRTRGYPASPVPCDEWHPEARCCGGHAGGLEGGRALPGLLASGRVLEPLHPVHVLVGLQKVAAESDERTCIWRDARWQSGSGGRAHFFCTTPGCAESSLCWRIRPTSPLVKHLTWKPCFSWKSARATAGREHGCELEGGIVVSEVRRRRTRAELELLRVLLLLLPSPPGHVSGEKVNCPRVRPRHDARPQG